MAILVNENTKAIIQGITGESGLRFVNRMQEYGSPPVAGVTPGKGGQNVQGVPVYDTVVELLKHHQADWSSINVPPAFVKDAVYEAIDAGIKNIFIYAERVPIHDAMEMTAFAEKKGVTIVGPNTPGLVSPGKFRLGGLGGAKDYVKEIFTPGPVGLVSRSGGMTSTIAYYLSRSGFGQTTGFGCGGDAIIGTPFKKALALFENDPETKIVVMFGEIGTSYEEEAAAFIMSGGFTKPAVAFIAGKNALPGFRFGHAGALVMKDRGTYEGKIKALAEAGVRIAHTLQDIPRLVGETFKEKERSYLGRHCEPRAKQSH
ncbi:MAG: CoA-binding protein [Elusimicrobia bacterium]|nr:CoA-binding protein [Elusimicrobiota bacterium]